MRQDSESTNDEAWGDIGTWLKILIPIAVIGGLFVLGRTVPLDDYVQFVQKWSNELGTWAPAGYVVFYVVATLLALPGTPFTLLAAFLFGTTRGFWVMVVATTLAASTGFLVARYGARETFEKKFKDSELFMQMVEMSNGNHWIVIPFMRLMPFFPFTFNNYALGLTRIPFWKYILVSELVMLPMNALLIFGAGFIYRATVKGEVSWTLMGISTGAGVLVLLLGFAAKRLFGSDESADDE